MGDDLDVQAVKIAAGRWELHAPREKLGLRASLPGAFGFERATSGFAFAVARGARRHDLLPAAMPTSWMLNARAPSPVFRRWLSPPCLAAWHALLEVLEASAPLAASDVTALVSTLAIDGHGVAAISKVLASLVPARVPLMDDAAIAFALGTVAMPETADDPKAGAEHFAPMVAWFESATRSAAPLLAELHDGGAFAGSHAPRERLLDHLLWFDSWGHRVISPTGWKSELSEGARRVVRAASGAPAQ